MKQEPTKVQVLDALQTHKTVQKAAKERIDELQKELIETAEEYKQQSKNGGF